MKLVNIVATVLFAAGRSAAVPDESVAEKTTLAALRGAHVDVSADPFVDSI